MKYFYDTEFWERPNQIDLISIGVVCEDGREYYAESSDFPYHDAAVANPWLRENVLPHIGKQKSEMKPLIEIASELNQFFFPEYKVELWGYYSAYDHVALMWLFGPMISKPKQLPMFTRDIIQLCKHLGNPALPEVGKGEHNALHDARWNKKAYEYLDGLSKKEGCWKEVGE